MYLTEYEKYDESSDNKMKQLVTQWEAASQLPKDFPTKAIQARFGSVFARK